MIDILVYPSDCAAYGRLCRLLSMGKRRAPKGQCFLCLHDLIEHEEGLLAVVLPPPVLDQHVIDVLKGLKQVFDDDRLSLSVSRFYGSDDQRRYQQLEALSDHVGVPLVATNAVLYHEPSRRPLQDVLTCIRLGCTLDEAGLNLLGNAERYLKPPDEMARLFGALALSRSAVIAERASGFNLDQLRYEYPHEICPPGVSPMQHLVSLTRQHAVEKYPHGVPQKVQRQLEHEFSLIKELGYAPYFLTVHDLVVFARSRDILCQGRGAAANSAVCYCLGVTNVDPDRIDVLFERFVSKQRNEPPDIDIDFEHERREEVIQYIYRKYGRDRAALTAEVITYRRRSAVREVGKVLGLSLDTVDSLAKNVDWWEKGRFDPRRLRELGLNSKDPMIEQLGRLTDEILGFPRHLSQHVGGFVITQTPLCELVPIENAAMEDRTIIEWDKDDIDAMGMLKVDVLGLGMLTCIRKALAVVEEATKRRSDEATEGKNWSGNPFSQLKEFCDGQDKNFSRFDCVVAGDGAGREDVRSDGQDASLGKGWSNRPDAAGYCVDTVEHCGRARPPEQSGLFKASVNCPGLAGGAFHTARTGHPTSTDQIRSSPGRFYQRRRSDPSRTHPKSGKQNLDQLPPPSSLRRFVASSLLRSIPPDDPRVYDMICRADTVGVFQIESRAQMSMLPRLKPRCFYDLVVEVAIVRPGPIHGKMVHPYLRRRNGEEPVTYPTPSVKQVLEKTLGVPLFQEQAMRLAIVAAGFTPDEADRLRRAIAAWKSRKDAVMDFGDKLIQGMIERGCPREFAERCFEQIKGFSEYGFPESHAASFAYLVYVSAWLKCHYPAAFAAALINSQPMGFYAPAQIIRDVQEHGVEVRPVDVNCSRWDCELESDPEKSGATPKNPGRSRKIRDRLCDEGEVGAVLRLGMRLVKGLRQEEAERIVEAVGHDGPFVCVEALWRTSGVQTSTLKILAGADAFASMGLDRQAALWQVRNLHDEDLPIFDQAEAARQTPVALPAIPEPRKVVQDYATLGLSLKAHPLSFVRAKLKQMGVRAAIELRDESQCPHGCRVGVAGIVLVRQRPGTASGIIFMTLEDETAVANLIVRPHIFECYRRAARHGIAIVARGQVERKDMVVHIMVNRIDDISGEIVALTSGSRDFH